MGERWGRGGGERWGRDEIGVGKEEDTTLRMDWALEEDRDNRKRRKGNASKTE